MNLLLAYLLLRLFYRRQFHFEAGAISPEPVRDASLAKLARASLVILVVLIFARIVTVLLGLEIDFRLTYIALVAALPVLVFTPWRPGLLKRLDWPTLVFFAAMFVLMQSVWDAGLFQSLIKSTNVDLTSTGMIMAVSVLLSQLLSNVPLVALYLPLLTQNGVMTKGMMALAAGSTIAGNLTILGAASNVIIIQNAEKRRGPGLTFLEFVRIGVPLTALNVAVYWAFLRLL